MIITANLRVLVLCFCIKLIICGGEKGLEPPNFSKSLCEAGARRLRDRCGVVTAQLLLGTGMAPGLVLWTQSCALPERRDTLPPGLRGSPARPLLLPASGLLPAACLHSGLPCWTPHHPARPGQRGLGRTRPRVSSLGRRCSWVCPSQGCVQLPSRPAAALSVPRRADAWPWLRHIQLCCAGFGHAAAIHRRFPRLQPHYLIKRIRSAAGSADQGWRSPVGTRLRGRGQGWCQPSDPAGRSWPTAQAPGCPAAAGSGLLRARGQPKVGTGLGGTGLGLPAHGELWVLLGLWLWGHRVWGLCPLCRHWHLSPGTFCCHWGSAGSPGTLQGSGAPVTFPFPSLASAKRVCYIFNILRALLVGI